MFQQLFALLRQSQKRQRLSFRLRNLFLKDMVEGLTKSAKGDKS